MIAAIACVESESFPARSVSTSADPAIGAKQLPVHRYSGFAPPVISHNDKMHVDLIGPVDVYGGKAFRPQLLVSTAIRFLVEPAKDVCKA